MGHTQAERIVNTPTPEEQFAMDLRDMAYRIDAVRYSENLSGVGQNQLYLVWKWLHEKADAFERMDVGTLSASDLEGPALPAVTGPGVLIHADPVKPEPADTQCERCEKELGAGKGPYCRACLQDFDTHRLETEWTWREPR
jgi:hypothetical protein